MVNVEELTKAYESSGVTVTFIANYMGCSRNKVYAMLKGGECSVTEMIKFCEALRLTKEQRDAIFLSESVN